MSTKKDMLMKGADLIMRAMKNDKAGMVICLDEGDDQHTIIAGMSAVDLANMVYRIMKDQPEIVKLIAAIAAIEDGK